MRSAWLWIGGAIALFAAGIGPARLQAGRPTETSRAAGAPAAPPIEQLLAESEKSLKARQWTRADALLRAVLRQVPDHDVAATRLRAIYGPGGIALPVDQEQLDETLGVLGGSFQRSETEHFVILSDCARPWTTARAQVLERTYDQVHRFMTRIGLEPVPPAAKLLCVLINDHAAYTAFARARDGVEASWIAGYYAALSNRVVFYNDATSPAFVEAASKLDQFRAATAEAEHKADSASRKRDGRMADRLRDQARAYRQQLAEQTARLAEQATEASISKTVHEATHLIAFNCGLQARSHQYPFWLTEGLATCFETERPNQSFGPDEANESRQAQLESAAGQGLLVPLDVLIAMNSVAGDDADAARVMYAQAYSLFRYLARYERRELAAYFRDIASDPPGAISPRRQTELFRSRFGEPTALERRWLRETVPPPALTEAGGR